MQILQQKYQPLTRSTIGALPQYQNLSSELQHIIQVVSAVFPFRANRYVTDNLIDWDKVPDDPIFQLTFPQQKMLDDGDFYAISSLVKNDMPRAMLHEAVKDIWFRHNPHPAGQVEHNVPRINGEPIPGLQHKYDETVLMFPSRGQTCHAYCSYCFRWPQFVGMQDLKFAAENSEGLVSYLRLHPEVTDVLFTGGDPAVMKTRVLESYIEPLLAPEFDHVQSIRIGTKALAYWPYRFVSDSDADDLLRLFARIIKKGRHVAIMAHYSHPRELSTPVARQAIKRLRDVGCQVRMQAPLMRHINDDSHVWAALWREGVNLGLIPYYMFVSRDTGPRNYFEVSLVRMLKVFNGAYRQVSGLSRTVRGPVMSASPGKVLVDGVAQIAGLRVFVLQFIQARNADWVGRPFFARFDPEASWFTDLKPAFSAEFFFDAEMAMFKRQRLAASSSAAG
jgi:KamA family protein